MILSRNFLQLFPFFFSPPPARPPPVFYFAEYPNYLFNFGGSGSGQVREESGQKRRFLNANLFRDCPAGINPGNTFQIIPREPISFTNKSGPLPYITHRSGRGPSPATVKLGYDKNYIKSCGDSGGPQIEIKFQQRNNRQHLEERPGHPAGAPSYSESGKGQCSGTSPGG